MLAILGTTRPGVFEVFAQWSTTGPNLPGRTGFLPVKPKRRSFPDFRKFPEAFPPERTREE